MYVRTSWRQHSQLCRQKSGYVRMCIRTEYVAKPTFTFYHYQFPAYFWFVKIQNINADFCFLIFLCDRSKTKPYQIKNFP